LLRIKIKNDSNNKNSITAKKFGLKHSLGTSKGGNNFIQVEQEDLKKDEKSSNHDDNNNNNENNIENPKEETTEDTDDESNEEAADSSDNESTEEDNEDNENNDDETKEEDEVQDSNENEEENNENEDDEDNSEEEQENNNNVDHEPKTEDEETLENPKFHHFVDHYFNTKQKIFKKLIKYFSEGNQTNEEEVKFLAKLDKLLKDGFENFTKDNNKISILPLSKMIKTGEFLDWQDTFITDFNNNQLRENSPFSLSEEVLIVRLTLLFPNKSGQNKLR